jgi:hypothetical protein
MREHARGASAGPTARKVVDAQRAHDDAVGQRDGAVGVHDYGDIGDKIEAQRLQQRVVKERARGHARRPCVGQVKHAKKRNHRLCFCYGAGRWAAAQTSEASAAAGLSRVRGHM